jgi:hypothetical protein
MNARIGFSSGALAGALLALAAVSAEAQLPAHLRDYPLARLHDSGDLVAPFFDGWYDNGDGTVTYSFGFLNRNTDEIVDIPLGPGNRLEPASLDGAQPTHFPVYDRRGLTGKRERGAFGVTVPKGTEVVWTLTHAGRTTSVPARSREIAYEMSWDPAAFGSLHPAVRFSVDGPESRGPEGVVAGPVRARVGVPVTLEVMARDRGEREAFGDFVDPVVPLNVTWELHQGAPAVTFEPQSQRGIEGEGWSVAATSATFGQPGEYLVRVRVDNFGAPDSKFDNMCCWSNGYVPVVVEP